MMNKTMKKNLTLIAIVHFLLLSGTFRRTEATAGATNEGVSAEKLKSKLPDGADVTNSCCSKLKKLGFESNLPVIVIDTKCQEVVDEPKIRTELCTCSDEMDYASWAGIEIRGSSSARDHEKKGMAVRLWNATGHDQKFPLLGLPKDDDWVLYGPETDRSIGLRNFLAYNISRSMGHYASRTKFVEVFLQVRLLLSLSLSLFPLSLSPSRSWKKKTRTLSKEAPN